MKARIRRIGSVLFVAVAITYLVRSLWGGQGLSEALLDTDLRLWSASIVAFVPMFWAQGIYHANTLRLMDPEARPGAPRADLATYLQSQIVRYIPGKVWGVLYQVDASRSRHPAARVLGGNLWQTLITNFLSLGLAASLILWGTGLASVWTAAAFALASMAGIEWFHRSRQPGHWYARLVARLPLVARLRGVVPPAPRAWRGTALLLAEWVFFAAGLYLLLWNRLPPDQSIVALGWYAASSTLAIAAVAVPAGLAVREAVFVGGQELIASSSEVLVVIAAQVRLSMLAAELLTCVLATLNAKVRGYG